MSIIGLSGVILTAGHLMDDIRKQGGDMFTKPRPPIVTEFPAVR